MRNKTLVAAVAAALMTSGAAMAQVKGTDTGVEPAGPSNGNPEGVVGLPGITCSSAALAGPGATNCSTAIPDNSPETPAVSTITLERCEGAITDVNVGIDASHTWVGDLTFTVTAPDSTAVTIVDQPGVPASLFGCSGDNIFAVLDDAAGAPVEDECAGGVPTIDGTFTPNNPLSAFNGLDANGEWTLSVTDSAGGDTGSLNDWSLEIAPEGCEAFRERPPQASFWVQKDYADDNPAPVEVTLTCNTGLPLIQSTTIDPTTSSPLDINEVVFIVNDFEDGAMDCEVTESVPAGYTPLYFKYDDGGFVEESPDSCVFEGVAHGDFASSVSGNLQNFCLVGNVPDFSTVTVNKEWIDENPQFNSPDYAEATYFCDNLPTVTGIELILSLGIESVGGNGLTGDGGGPISGNLEFIGNPGVDTFGVYGNWDGGTMCSVTEQVVEGGVETDASDCDSIVVMVGEDAECTLVNTRLYEGIPTLSQYGLGLLALLMLGMGFVAFRRIV